MDTPNKDARGFVEGVVRYLSSSGKSTANLPKMKTYLMRMTGQARRQRHAHVESSVSLTVGEKQEFRQFLTQLMHHSVALHYSVNTRLIGGFRIRVGDWVVDTTLSGQLDTLATSLL
jgi:F-type H+-transporting ATPase subunit delta